MTLEPRSYRLWSGNDAVAHGAVAAGCGFFAGYPITPATSIYERVLDLLPPKGGVVVQAEDEIAALGLCLGASMAGLRAMTATSGPGISLMSENLAFAIGSEIPVVVVDVQRLGPSTGSATRGADGDVQLLRWGCSGGMPVIVLAPADVRECHTLTVRAFNLADRFRCPVFVASNKEVGQTREGIDPETLPPVVPIPRRPPPSPERFLPFEPLPGAEVPGFLPLGGDVPVRQTSSTHGRDGFITTDSGQILEGIGRLEHKLLARADDLADGDVIGHPEAETAVVTYGVTARAARQVVEELVSEGARVKLVVVRSLWPVPEGWLHRALIGTLRVVVAEMNTGLYAREIRRLMPGIVVDRLGHLDGRLVSPAEIREATRG